MNESMASSINWPQIIQDIKARNEISFKAIGRMVGMSKDAIRKVAIGKTPEPHYSVGVKLLEIHKRTS